MGSKIRDHLCGGGSGEGGTGERGRENEREREGEGKSWIKRGRKEPRK